MVPIGWAVVGFTLLYVIGVFGLRELGPLRMPRTAVPPKVELAPGVYGTDPKIAHFYAGTGVLTKGEHAVVCYGVQNVRSVRLDPPEEELKPALNRCFAVAPQENTTYTLYAETADGRTLSESFTLQVNPAKPWFSMVATSGKEIVRGEKWSICYSTDDAVSVRLEPLGRPLPPGKKQCLMLVPVQDMDYWLVAKGEGGDTISTPKIHVTVVAKKQEGRGGRVTRPVQNSGLCGVGEAHYCRCFIVERFEQCVEARNLQKIVKPLLHMKQLDLSAAVRNARVRSYHLAEPGAVHITHARKVQQNRRTPFGCLMHRLSQQTCRITQRDAAVEVDNGDCAQLAHRCRKTHCLPPETIPDTSGRCHPPGKFA
jgi:hypothetical protein